MDVAVEPELLFQYNSELYNSLVMNSFQSQWIDSTTFEAEIWALPDTNNLIALDLNCISAEDRNGNMIIDSLYIDRLVSDLKHPEVISAASSFEIISDQIVGANDNYVEIEFNEPMDIEIQPLVYFEGGTNVNGSIQYNVLESGYTDSLNYRAYFQILDEDIEIDSIDLKITLGADKSQNSQENKTYPVFIMLDTKNPSIIDIAANTNTLNETDNLLNISLRFDEPMDTDILPTINYNPLIISPVILNQNNIQWITEDSLITSFELISGGQNQQLHAIEISEGADLAGNVLVEFQEESFLTIEGAVEIIPNKYEPIALHPNIVTSGLPVNLVNIPNEYQGAEIKLYNSAGKLLYKSLTENHETQIMTSQLSSGIYILKVQQETLRLIIL